MKPTDFAERLTHFLGEYLPAQRNASPNTVKSYAQAFSLLLVHCRKQHHLSPQRLTLDHLTVDVVLSFLKDLEESRGCAVTTRNQRLAAIHSFFKYLQTRDPERLLQYQRILAVSGKRAPANLSVNHLAPERMKALLAGPDLRTMCGRRDATLLSLLYDAGLRVQELIGLTPGQVRMETPAQVSVMGKGRKRRLIPLLEPTVELLKTYLCDQGLDSPEKRDLPLFFNRQGSTLTRSGVWYIVRKYAAAMDADAAGIREHVTPHTFRHSKAMHLLQSGNPLAVIQSFLGHSDIRTTTVYARADLEMTRAALEKTTSATPKGGTAPWMKQPDLLEWLRKL
jgi:site-specific recombinase XerD